MAIPLLEQHDVAYYNPQVDDWKPELVAIEAGEKATVCEIQASECVCTR